MKAMHITVIAPYEGLQKTVKRVIQQQKQMKYELYLADLQEAIPIIEKVDDKTDLYISRGGTAKIIKAHTSKQVVEIPISGYDILRTLLLIQDEKDGAEIIAFENISSDFYEISQLLGIEVPITSIESENEVEKAVIRAKESGRRVIIGDTVTNQIAQRYGVEGILITSGEESVKQAFEQAETIRQVHHFYDEENQLYKVLAKEIEEPYFIVEEKEIRFKSDTLKKLEKKENLGMMLQALFELNEYEYNQELRHILYSNGKPYQIYVQPLKEKLNHSIVYIRSMEKVIPSFCRWFQTDGLSLPLVLGTDIVLENHFNEVVEKEGPILITSVEGSGERCITEAILANQWAIECDLNKEVDIDLLFSTQMPLFLLHLDQLLPSKQLEIVEAANQYANPVVFFCESQIELRVFEGRVFELPTLSKRLQHDLSFIRAFISRANSRYGKQVIGIKNTSSEIQELSHRHSLVSFRDLIFREIERADSPHILLQVDRAEQEKEGFIHLDLTKSLDEMESEIIQKVLEDEGFNQSKTAKRLNINRTTVWRKLK
ncbi:sigma-54-dependent Fis family transcriptional regulator [Alkalicoccobacillus plakortidis]|uniref:PrpR N-terminal domain-containing protein n=1 Tax=Alkalicoccobacillus plakortidis TaxID=444060 RepID=A0ABT0XIV3_9BACI|nr:sigma-54-dependent Fis family transcriptional regulator [Alkalicoccobacillus plakortidis]MCM2675821.1 PrpR N-terminal domain-containing protein [Alkalicoccobacillus plakortidis]